MRYDNEQLSEMCNKFNLLEYVSHSNEVKRIGGHSYILCPCHHEKTPSCLIDEHSFHCFGCGIGGSPIDFLMRAEGLQFSDAVSKLAQLTGCDKNSLRQCETLSYYKTVRNMLFGGKRESFEHPILADDTMTKFLDAVPIEWVDEGISRTQIKRFGIKIDDRANRIVYPVHDNNDRLINVKGRTRFKNYKDMQIPKYMNYYKLGKLDFFCGMLQNRESIMRSKSAIIFEGIKSVMKLSDYGMDIGLSSETSALSDDQIKILIQMGLKDITIAYDSDVEMSKILSEISTLKRFTNVYIIQDKSSLTEAKMSPVDAGKDVWDMLYKARYKIS